MDPKNVMVPPQPVPPGRSCKDCACFYEVAEPSNPLARQAFCARNPAACSPIRLEEPVLDKDGKQVMDRLNPKAPAMRAVQGFGFAHTPTQPGLTCFDGWRPRGARPGERGTDYALRQAVGQLLPLARENLSKLPEADATVAHTVLGALEAFAGLEPAANDPAAPAVDLAGAEPLGNS